MSNEAEILRALHALQNDMRAMRSEAATKQDLARFATKDDLEPFATKQDLARFATKDDLEGTELNLLAFMRDHMVTKRDLEAITSQVLTHVDGLAAHNQIFDHELLMMRNRMDRLEERLAN